MNWFLWASGSDSPVFQNDNSGGFLAILLPCIYCFCLALFIVPTLAGLWKLFDKAGKPAWASIVPIYNMLVIDEIIGRPQWWILLYFVAVGGFILPFDIAKSYGKDTTYALGLLFLPFVFYPMLGFGDAKYMGPMAQTPAMMPPPPPPPPAMQ